MDLLKTGLRKVYVNPVILSLFLIAFAANAAESKKEKTFNFCSEGNPTSLNPELATDATTFSVTRHIYDRLVDFEYGDTKLKPSLAERWTVSSDGLSYTFYLRKNVQWHTSDIFKPTRNFNADDVIYSFERQKNDPDRYSYYSSMDMDDILQEIKKAGDDKVIFVLKKPNASFVANLAMDFASIVSKEYSDFLKTQNKNDFFDTRPVGTGPFILKTYMKDQYVEMEAFDKYWRGKAKIAKLNFMITPNVADRFEKIKKGDCDMEAYPTLEQVDKIKKEKEFTVLEKPGSNIGYIAINTQKKPLDDPKVRLAIQHALNKKSYIESGAMGQAIVAKNIIPPTMFGYNDSIKDFDYNPEKSKNLLKEAGYPDGLELELWTLPVSRPYILDGKRLGELMKNDLAQVGIKIKLKTYDWASYLKKSKAGEHELLQIGWVSDNGDPDNILYTLLSCSAVETGTNRSRWCDKSYNEIVEKARMLTNHAQRAELYKKALTIIHENVPVVTLNHSKVFRVIKKNVLGYKVDPLGVDYFYLVDIK